LLSSLWGVRRCRENTYAVKWTGNVKQVFAGAAWAQNLVFDCN